VLTIEIAFKVNMPEGSRGKLMVFAIKETAMMLIQCLPHTFSTLLARPRSPRGHLTPLHPTSGNQKGPTSAQGLDGV
jgi:hypothetical protein